MDRGFAEFREVYREAGIDADAFAKTLDPWLRTNTRRPFFAYAHFREPHFPYDPPTAFAERFGAGGPIAPSMRRDREWVFKANDGSKPLSAAQADHLVRLYDGNLAFADQEIGGLRRTLEATGLWEQTAVIVTADHGEALYEHQFIMHNQQLYEDSVRVPLVVRFPPAAGVAGGRVGGLVDSTDIAPTIADILGVPERPPAGFRGRSLLPAILGAPGKPFAFSRSLGERPLFSVRDARYTFILDSRGGREELYDRSADPGEKRNLIGQKQVRAALLRQVLWTWMAGLARRRGAEAGDASLASDQRENLKSLGYVQ
jgi:arylsulfatase A-like enzyme